MEKYSLGVLHHLSRTLKLRINNNVQHFGLTGQQSRIITFIGFRSAKEDVFQRTIEEEFHIRPSSVTSILKLLEKNGYIKRESVASDARLKKLVLTSTGQEVWEHIGEVIEREDEKVLNRLTKEEQKELFRLLKKLTETDREATND